MSAERARARGPEVLRALIHGALPLLLLLTGVRLAMTPAYVHLAYRVPGFPEDSYGFSRAERLLYANRALAYLLNDAGIEFLGEQAFEDGERLYNGRELRHMEDVKALARVVVRLWGATLAAVILSSGALVMMDEPQLLGQALVGGGKLTVGLMLGLALALVVSFPLIFVGFHRVFFEGNTWLFRYSDTLIRLFPERFWQQVFAFLTLVAGGTAGLLILVGRWIGAKATEQG